MGKKGFTLIEIIIVIVIIGILATLALPRIAGQMESARGAEAMKIFGVLKNAMADCISMTNNDTSVCVTSANLGVAIPTSQGGTPSAFTYSTAQAANQFTLKATRTSGAGSAICVTIVTQDPGNLVSVTYGSFPANGPFTGIVQRTGTFGAACANATVLANVLN